MKITTKLLISCAFLGATQLTLGQSNSPCNGAGAPALTVGSTCSYTTGTTAGASEQTNNNNFGTPTCGSMGEDVWYSFTAPASGNVTITTQAGSITDGVMALYDADCAGTWTQLGCSDDVNGLMPEISNSTLTPGQTYYIRFWEYGGGSGTFDICVTAGAATTAPTNTDCSVPDPICSGSPIVFTAQANGTEADVVNPGNNYDCLSTSPNPSWYYLEIDNGGSLDIDITAGSDVDFAIWGPYTDLANALANCDSHGMPVDCSYSTAAVEQANVSGTVSGEVYVLLVTNYANTVQTITVNDAATSSATTNCAIVLPVELAGIQASENEYGVQVTWTTVTEQDNDYFVLERSSDGEVWSAVGAVKGVGNSTTPQQYGYADRNAQGAMVFYRLKQFDIDGRMTISEVISAQRSIAQDIVLYPNPAANDLTIKSQSEFSDIQIKDLSGAVVLTKTQNWNKECEVDLSNLRSGVYFVSIHTKNGLAIQRLTKY